MNFKLRQPTPMEVEKVISTMYESFRFYYCQKPGNVLSQLVCVNDAFIVQDGFFTRCVTAFHHPLHYKIILERNIREFFHHHFKQHMSVTTNALNEVRRAFNQVQRCYYKGYERDPRLSSVQKTKIGLIKKHYETELRVWEEFSTTHIGLCSMLPCFEDHLKHEFKYFKKHACKVRKKYTQNYKKHKKLMLCVHEELYLAVDAIKKHFKSRRKNAQAMSP